MVLKIKNNNNESVNIENIYMIFKDENGKYCKLNTSVSDFKIEPKGDVYICNESEEGILYSNKVDYSKYSDIELYVALKTSSSWSLFDSDIDEDDIELNDIKKEDCIEVTVKNNGYEDGISRWDDEVKSGESKVFKIDFPTDEQGTDITFDEYEVRLFNAK